MKTSLLALATLLLAPLAMASDKLAAEYEVPVPAELEAYSRYQMSGIKVRSDGRRLEVSYKLPLELTGIENHLKFEGVDDGSGVVKLTGNHGSMECQAEAGLEACRVKYYGVRQDLSAVERLLDAQRLPQQEKVGRLAVAARFGGDMEGIIRYRLPLKAYRPGN